MTIMLKLSEEYQDNDFEDDFDDELDDLED